MTSDRVTIGIIGGTGLYQLEGLENVEQLEVRTPFGLPSSAIASGELDGARLLFVARHGIGHRILPSEVNSRANIYALKQLGASWVLGVSAVGSLREDYEPGDLVVPDQLIDRTKYRASTFFGEGIVAHIPFADPFCPVLAECLAKAGVEGAAEHKMNCKTGGTYICMEGPAFSTRAESNWYRAMGASLIGMTALPEAKLAREAELSYAILALVTDYDCWRDTGEAVHVHEVLSTMARNVQGAKEVIRRLVPLLQEAEPSPLAARSLDAALITPSELWPRETAAKLEAILARIR